MESPLDEPLRMEPDESPQTPGSGPLTVDNNLAGLFTASRCKEPPHFLTPSSQAAPRPPLSLESTEIMRLERYNAREDPNTGYTELSQNLSIVW